VAILGGGIHMVIMDALVIAGLCVVFVIRDGRPIRVISAAAVTCLAGLLVGAVQVLPSIEYAPLAWRWVGGVAPIRALDKIPYQYVGEMANFSPRALFAFLLGGAYPGDHSPGNYIGVLPLTLSIAGAAGLWRVRYVRYFVAAGLLSFAYSLGSFSFLHGVLYLVPGLDMAREAARFILITHFAIAILAGYGTDYLFSSGSTRHYPVTFLLRAFRWLVVFLAALLIVGVIQDAVSVSNWVYLSFLFISGTYVILELLRRGISSAPTKVLLVFVLLWDLYSFNWIVQNKSLLQAANQDYMAQFLNTRELAGFLKSQDSPFRIHFDAEFPPNIGDTWRIPMTGGMSATMLTDYTGLLGHPRMAQLLNVRYTLRRTERAGDQQPVFSDGTWRVYENVDAGDRAWLVHRVEVDASVERPLKRLGESNFNPREAAILERPLEVALENVAGNSSVETTAYDPTSMEFRVNTPGRALLVVSEIFYPGWQAAVNGSASEILRVNGILRGVVVPGGTSIVRLDYRPASVRAGAVLGLTGVFGTILLGLVSRRRGQDSNNSRDEEALVETDGA
jgi:hypothetical protein